MHAELPRGARGRHGEALGRLAAAVPEWPLLTGAGFGAASLAENIGRAAAQGSAGPAASELSTMLLLGLAATLPVAFAAARPCAAAVVVTAAVLLTLGGDHEPTAAALAALLAVLCLVGLRRTARFTVPLAAPYVAYALAPFGGGAFGRWHWPAVALLAAVAGALVLGAACRGERETRARGAAARAARDSLLAHVARGERARIARELHDVVAHHISLIAVQTETARLTTPGLPAQGARHLVAIGDTAREALAEMRRLLGVLREDAYDAGAGAERAPQPGLEQLGALVDEARAASGTSTRLIVTGPVVPLGRGAELAVYRIVQEALTNARRHAAGAPVDVELRYTGTSLRVQVRDLGPGPGPARDGSGGHGLVGMRERAAMVGGVLRAGPAPAGGFVVEAEVPVGDGDRAREPGRREEVLVG